MGKEAESLTLFLNHRDLLSADAGSVIPNAIWEKLVADMEKSSARLLDRTAKATRTSFFAELEGEKWNDIFGTIISHGNTTLMVVGRSTVEPRRHWGNFLILTGTFFAHDPGETVNIDGRLLTDWKIEV